MRQLRFAIFITLLALAPFAGAGCRSEQVVKRTGDPAKDTATARQQTALAYDLIEKGDFKKARTVLDRAIAIDPFYGPAYNNLGVLAFEIEQFYDAAWAFQNAIKLMPQSAEPINNLGLVLEAAGKAAEAEKQYDAASILEPRNVEYAANRARVRVRQGKFESPTLELLDYIRLYDRRPEWTEWAANTLSRVHGTWETAPSDR